MRSLKPRKSGRAQVFVGANESILRSKRDCYRSCGWLESDIHDAFVRYPYCMKICEKKIMANMNFLVDKLGCKPAAVAQFPVILELSLEKRVTPRCKVGEILKEKGFLKTRVSCMAALLKLTENEVLEEVYHQIREGDFRVIGHLLRKIE